MNLQFNQTPSKALQESQFNQQQNHVVQSRFYYNDNQQTNQKADSIENSIKDIGQQLKKLFNEMQNHTDKYSEEYIQLEAQRKELKKRLLDLDFEHKMIFANRIRNQKKNEAPKIQESPQNVPKDYNQKQSKQLVQSRRKLRIEQLEAELASSRIRNSRIQQLSKQLQYLRMSYSDPYLTYHSYPYYSYGSYPYSTYYGLYNSRLWF